MKFKQMKEELTWKFLDTLDNLISEYNFAMKAIDNMEKSNLHKRDDEYDY